MFKVVVGHSDDPDTDSAAAEIVAQCEAALDNIEPQAGILFCAIDFEHQRILDRILDRWPDLSLIGCTTDGEMSSALAFQQDSVVLTLLASDTVRFSTALAECSTADPSAAAHAATEQAMAALGEQARLCILIPESLGINGLAVMEAVRDVLPGDVPLVGGLAADQWRFHQTFQFHGRRVYSGGIPLLLIGGPIRFSHGVASGWKPIGKLAEVNRSSGNTVYEIDGRPALSFYRDHLGDHEPSSNYPLAIYEPDGRFYLRAPNGDFDDDSGSVSFFAAVPEGASVRMSETTRDDVLEATTESMKQALETFPGGTPDLAMFFSCASRRQLLGTRTGEEFERARSSSEAPLACSGFYTNGEISPLSGSQSTRFHNETFITLLLGAD